MSTEPNNEFHHTNCLLSFQLLTDSMDQNPFKELIVAQVHEKFSVPCGIWRFVAVFTKAQNNQCRVHRIPHSQTPRISQHLLFSPSSQESELIATVFRGARLIFIVIIRAKTNYYRVQNSLNYYTVLARAWINYYTSYELYYLCNR
jgi:hypothetical protein